MNRAERRKHGIKSPPAKMVRMKETDYTQRINLAYRKGYDYAFDKASNLAVAFMLSVPLLVLHESFGEIRLKEFNGKSREEHFFELCISKYEEYNDKEDAIALLMNEVSEKTGFDIAKIIMEQEDST